MVSKRRRLTAEELKQQLQRDPEFASEQNRKGRQRREAHAKIRAAEAPVLDDLRKLGFELESISELLNTRADYRQAVPVLMEWLPRTSNRAVKETIVRALSVPWAKPHAAPLLVQQFRDLDDDPQSMVRWAIGNALEVVADDSVFADLAEFALDRRYGTARQMIVMALGNMRDPRAVDVLMEVLDHDEVAGHAIAALGKLKAAKARSAIQPFLQHRESWVRQEARKALARIERH